MATRRLARTRVGVEKGWRYRARLGGKLPGGLGWYVGCWGWRDLWDEILVGLKRSI
jgi:hypothetical protein